MHGIGLRHGALGGGVVGTVFPKFGESGWALAPSSFLDDFHGSWTIFRDSFYPNSRRSYFNSVCASVQYCTVM